jgi:glycosyltransferase involved in cell wall biosynthesis
MIKEFSLSCIIPMYNEEESVEKVIRGADEIFSNIIEDWEIIIIESGSTDRTWEKVNEQIKDRKNIRAFHQEKKSGMGSALKFGYSKCTKDFICHLEADNPFEMIYFKKAMPILLENDFVIGYRVGTKENLFKWSYLYNGRMSAYIRAAYHICYNLLLRLLFGLVVRDVNFSFKIFRRKFLKDIELISNGWFIDAELILAMRDIGVLPIEIPVEYKDRMVGLSTINLMTPVTIFLEMLEYLRYRKKQRR